MADSQSAGLGEDKDTEKDDKERERRAVKSEKNKDKCEVTETFGFYDKNGSRKGKKSNLSGESLLVHPYFQFASQRLFC